jgi:succinate dehydrogenase/fumarate reductase flavoprotein subunit
MGAITAARRGLRTLVVEKGAFLGGSTALSGGGTANRFGRRDDHG